MKRIKTSRNCYLNSLTALFGAVIVLLFFGCSQSLGDGVVLFDGQEPPSTIVTLEEDGECYEVYAAEGQVMVLFKETVSHKEAEKILKKNRAKIIAQIPNAHYYLIKVNKGKEGAFVTHMSTLSDVDFVFPNAIDRLYSAQPYVFENFSYSDHGDRVIEMFGDSSLIYNTLDIGLDEKYVSSKWRVAIPIILDSLKKDESAVINLSFGPGLKLGRERILWDDASVNFIDRISYKRHSVNEMVGLIKSVKQFDDKDFIITKASGNEGMKEYELIVDRLKKKLSPEELAVFERHFIFVSAKDDYFQKRGLDYPNELSMGKYDKTFTTVDISDMTAIDTNWVGTSFSSPRAAGFIVKAANSHDMKVVDVLKYAQKATEYHPDHLLTYELMNELIQSAKDGKTEVTIDGVLTMYLVDTLNYYDDNYENYYEPEWGFPVYQRIDEYRKPKEHQYLAFVLESDKIIDVTKKLSSNTNFAFLDRDYQSSFMIVPGPNYSEEALAKEFVNKRVRIKGTLYVPWGDWRYLTNVVMNLWSIKLIDNTSRPIRHDGEEAVNDPSSYDYSFMIPYTEELFRSDEDGGRYTLSNGDVLRYNYYYSYSFLVSYYIRFYLERGNINSKYKIIAVETLNSETAFRGEGDHEGYIDVTFSKFGFLPMKDNQIFILVREK